MASDDGGWGAGVNSFVEAGGAGAFSFWALAFCAGGSARSDGAFTVDGRLGFDGGLLTVVGTTGFDGGALMVDGSPGLDDAALAIAGSVGLDGGLLMFAGNAGFEPGVPSEGAAGFAGTLTGVAAGS